jgi:hypothetical protein
LREHASQREFTDTAWTGEEQRVRHAPASEGSAERGDDSFIAEKLGEAHG